MNIGNNIKQLRLRKNLTQDQVAEKLGVSYQAVSKWENNANTPDIALLPEIADLFGVSIDALFSDDPIDHSDIHSFMKDDDVIRVVQLRGTKVIKVSSVLSPDTPPIEIAFPHDCNDRTQYFKVEVYGHIIADSSINGDVVCHQSIQSSTINGDVRSNGSIHSFAINGEVRSNGSIQCYTINCGEVRSDGSIKVNELKAQKVICKNIDECNKIEAETIECAGNVTATNLSCDQISYKHK